MEEKRIQYAAAITSAIGEMFNEDSDFYIDEAEFNDNDNLTEFFHALANIVPTHLFNEFTGGKKNQLEFNHVANQLCFQYSNRVTE